MLSYTTRETSQWEASTMEVRFRLDTSIMNEASFGSLKTKPLMITRLSSQRGSVITTGQTILEFLRLGSNDKPK